MQHLSHSSRRHKSISGFFCGCQDRVRFFALHRIKPHAPPLVRAPSIHLSFNLAAVLPCGLLNALAPEATPQGHNLQVDIVYGVDYRYLILFAPHAFAPERQSLSRPPSPPVFLQISTHFTATPNSTPSTRLKPASFECSSRVEPGDFIRLDRPPACALRPVIPINACTLRITAAAGTELAGASSAGNVNCCGY